MYGLRVGSLIHYGASGSLDSAQTLTQCVAIPAGVDPARSAQSIPVSEAVGVIRFAGFLCSAYILDLDPSGET